MDSDFNFTVTALFVCNIAQKLQAQTIYYRLILYVLTYVYVSQN